MVGRMQAVRIAAPSHRERLIRVRCRGAEEREMGEVSMGFIRSSEIGWRTGMAGMLDLGLGETGREAGRRRREKAGGPTCQWASLLCCRSGTMSRMRLWGWAVAAKLG